MDLSELLLQGSRGLPLPRVIRRGECAGWTMVRAAAVGLRATIGAHLSPLLSSLGCPHLFLNLPVNVIQPSCTGAYTAGHYDLHRLGLLYLPIYSDFG